MKIFQIATLLIQATQFMLQDKITYTEHIFDHLETELQLSAAIQKHGYMVANLYNDSDIASHIWEVKFRKVITALNLQSSNIYEINCSTSELCLKYNVHTFPVVLFYNKHRNLKIVPKKKGEFKKLVSQFINFDFKKITNENEFNIKTKRLNDRILVKSKQELPRYEFDELQNIFRLNPTTEVYYLGNYSNKINEEEEETVIVKFVRFTDLNKYEFEIQIPVEFLTSKESLEKLSDLHHLKLKPFKVFELDNLLHTNKPVVLIYLGKENEALIEEGLVFELLKENISYFYIVKNDFNEHFIDSHSLSKENKYLLFINGRKYRPKTQNLKTITSLKTELFEEVYVNSPLETNDGIFPNDDFRFGFEELNQSRLDDFVHSNESGVIVSYMGDLENDITFVRKMIKEIMKVFKQYKRGIIDKGLNDHKLLNRNVEIEIIGFINKDEVKTKKFDANERNLFKKIKELNKWFDGNKNDDDEEDL